MVYEPQVQVIDVRGIRDNLIAYMKEAQTDVLAWANDNRRLEEIKAFYKSARKVSVFPSLTCISMDHKAKWSDILEVDFSIVFEVALIHGNADTLADLGPKYAMALESMLVNVPETTFNEGSIIPLTSTGMATDTRFAAQERYGTGKFIEIFQTRATWALEASAYSN
jgi:hypothetical protein